MKSREHSAFVSGFDFQRKVADIFRKMLCDVVGLEVRTREGRRDIELKLGPVGIVVECKYYQTAVGSSEVEEFDKNLRKLPNPNLGILVAPKFIDPARRRCRELNIFPLTAQQLYEWSAQSQQPLRTALVSQQTTCFLSALAGLIQHCWWDLTMQSTVLRNDDMIPINCLEEEGYLISGDKGLTNMVSVEYSSKGISLANWLHTCALLLSGITPLEHFGQIREEILRFLEQLEISALSPNERMLLFSIEVLTADEHTNELQLGEYAIKLKEWLQT